MADTITTKEDSLDLLPFNAGTVVKEANQQDILAGFTTRITPQQGIGSYIIEVEATDGAFVAEGGVKPVTSSVGKVKIGNGKIIASAKYTIEAKASMPTLEDGFARSFPGQIVRAYNKTVLGLTPMPVGDFDTDFYTLENAPEIVISDQAGTTTGDKALAAWDAVYGNVTDGEVNAVVVTTRALATLRTYRNATTGVPYFDIDVTNKTINSVPYAVIKSSVFAIWIGDFTTLYQGLAVWENGAGGTKLFTEYFGGVGLNNEEVWVQEVFAASGSTDTEAIVKIVLAS